MHSMEFYINFLRLKNVSISYYMYPIKIGVNNIGQLHLTSEIYIYVCKNQLSIKKGTA